MGMVLALLGVDLAGYADLGGAEGPAKTDLVPNPAAPEAEKVMVDLVDKSPRGFP
jgi:hypothetical protein